MSTHSQTQAVTMVKGTGTALLGRGVTMVVVLLVVVLLMGAHTPETAVV